MLLLTGAAAHAEGGTKTVDLKIDGMVCSICEWFAERTLKSFPGVTGAKANFLYGRAEVTYDPNQISPEKIFQFFNSRSFYRASIAANRNINKDERIPQDPP